METQAKILAFDQLLEHDEAEREAQLAGARMPFGAPGKGKPSKGKSPKSKRR